MPAASLPGQPPGPAAVLYEGAATTLERTRSAGNDLWLTVPDLAQAAGWEIKPEGVCRDEMCVPLPAGRDDAFLAEDGGETWFNLSEFARHIEQPLAHDAAHGVWSFGPPSFAAQSGLAFQMAPDFTLPDFDGHSRSLSEFRGKKVFLVTWASW